ncbi:hypothetical protein IWX92DRAFT_359652 [Phyllosticta citricarpa]
MIGTLLALGLLDSWQSLWPSSLSSSAPRRNFSAQRASPLYWLFIFGFQDFRISVTSAPSTPALFTQLRRSAFCILHCSLTIPTRHWRVGVQFATKVHCGVRYCTYLCQRPCTRTSSVHSCRKERQAWHIDPVEAARRAVSSSRSEQEEREAQL